MLLAILYQPPPLTRVTCPSDEAIKEILLWQNDQLPPYAQFVIANLDRGRLLVKTSEVESIEEGLNLELVRLQSSALFDRAG